MTRRPRPTRQRPPRCTQPARLPCSESRRLPARTPPAVSAAAASTPSGVAYVGTYTPNGGGIYAFRVDPANGALAQFQVAGDIENPSWLALSPDQSRLYAVSEIDHYLGAHSGAVASYAIDPDTGISVRYWRGSDITTGNHIHRWDCMYGAAVLDQFLGTRVCGS